MLLDLSARCVVFCLETAACYARRQLDQDRPDCSKGKNFQTLLLRYHVHVGFKSLDISALISLFVGFQAFSFYLSTEMLRLFVNVWGTISDSLSLDERRSSAWGCQGPSGGGRGFQEVLCYFTSLLVHVWFKTVTHNPLNLVV